MNRIQLLALAGVLATSSALADHGQGSRSVYFCHQLVKPTVGPEIVKNPDGSRSYTIRSHVLAVFEGGGQPTTISLNGINDLTPAKSANDLLGKPVAGYAAYTMETDSGEADQWGANVFLENKLMSSSGKGEGRMIVRYGQEEGDPIDTVFYCSLNEGEVWRRNR